MMDSRENAVQFCFRGFSAEASLSRTGLAVYNGKPPVGEDGGLWKPRQKREETKRFHCKGRWKLRAQP